MSETASSPTEYLPISNDGDKRALSLEQIAEDLTLSNEEGNTWYNYRLPAEPTAVGTQRLLLADEYDDLGQVIATHNVWIEIEYSEAGTQPDWELR